MKILATNIGEKREVNWKGRLMTTGIFKFPVDKPVFLDREDVKGDAVCDRVHHGGIDQAVYGYSEKHYAYFKKLHPDLEWDYGMFGENLTLDDLDETQIHVGDTFKVGEAIVEVTKPRQPCRTLGVRFNNMKIVKQFWNSTMCGIYFKILQTGNVQKGDVLEQLKHCPENPSIADVYMGKRVEKGL